jgi:hypothetical protein
MKAKPDLPDGGFIVRIDFLASQGEPVVVKELFGTFT